MLKMKKTSERAVTFRLPTWTGLDWTGLYEQICLAWFGWFSWFLLRHIAPFVQGNLSTLNFPSSPHRQTSGLHSKAENRRQPPATRRSPEVRRCVAQPRGRLRPRHGRLHLPCGRTLPLRRECDCVRTRTVRHIEERWEGGVTVSRQPARCAQLQQQPGGQRQRPRPLGATRPSVGESVGRGTTRHLCNRRQRYNLHGVLFRLKRLSSEIKWS